MRYEFVESDAEGASSHAYLRVQLNSGMFVADYRAALERIELAYNRLEYLETESLKLSELLDLSDSERSERRYFLNRLRKRFPFPPHQFEEWGQLLDLLVLDAGRLEELRSVETFLTVRSHFEERLKSFNGDYRPQPERALVLDAASIQSPGFNDFLGVGKIIGVLVGAVGKYKVDKARARKTEAESRLVDAKARKSDVECEVVRAKAMKERASAMSETYKALTKMGYSPEAARDMIAREMLAAADTITPSLESGHVNGMNALPYPEKHSEDSGDGSEHTD